MPVVSRRYDDGESSMDINGFRFVESHAWVRLTMTPSESHMGNKGGQSADLCVRARVVGAYLHFQAGKTTEGLKKGLLRWSIVVVWYGRNPLGLTTLYICMHVYTLLKKLF